MPTLICGGKGPVRSNYDRAFDRGLAHVRFGNLRQGMFGWQRRNGQSQILDS